MGSLYPPPPSDLYLAPPVTQPHLFTPRPEVSPGGPGGHAGLARPRERERASSPAMRPGPANNSLLSDKLRLGFGVERDRKRPPPPPAEGNIKRETGGGLALLQEGFRKPSGSLAVTQTSSSSSSSSSLVSSSHSGEFSQSVGCSALGRSCFNIYFDILDDRFSLLCLNSLNWRDKSSSRT